MQSGFAHLKQTIDDAKNRGDFSGGSLGYFSWKDKDRKIVRFLTDDPIIADFHEFIVTNDGKTKSFIIDPDKGDFVTKYATPSPEVGGGLGWRMDYRTKQPSEHKPVKKGVVVAVERQLVPRQGGGFDVVDLIEDIDFKGESFKSRNFGLITQGLKNFWNSLIGYHGLYGTICDRDYSIERVGADKHTEYRIVPVDPVDELRDLKVVQEFYGYGREWNDDDPERFLFCPQTLHEWADYHSSEERAKFWLLPKADEPPVNGNPADAPVFAQPSASAPAFSDTSTPDEAQAAPQVAPPTGTDFASLRAKLMPHAPQAQKA